MCLLSKAQDSTAQHIREPGFSQPQQVQLTKKENAIQGQDSRQ